MHELGGYRLTAEVGRGTAASVWRARHVITGRSAAVKVLSCPRRAAPFERAVTRELRAGAKLAHPGVATIYDAGRVPRDAAVAFPAGSLWMAMQLAEHGALDPLQINDWWSLRRLLTRVLAALAHAHAHGVIHRNLKPENILLDGPHRDPLLTDFGSARLRAGRSQTTANLSGDAVYVAPEQIRGEWREHGPWTDLYALGCVVYQVLHGTTPFTGESGLEVAYGHLNTPPPGGVLRFPVPDGVLPWLRRLLAKPVAERWQSAPAAAQALPGGQSARPSSAPAPRRMPPNVSTSLLAMRQGVCSGRRLEQDFLWAQLDTVAHDRRARVVVLTGDTGSGKTTLGRWFARSSTEAGRAHALSLRARTPDGLAPIGELIGRFFETAGLDVQATTERVVDRLARWQPDLNRRIIADRVVRPVAQAIVEQSSAPPAGFAQLLSTWWQLLGAERPIVLWIDDAHRATETLACLDLAVQRLPQLPLLVVLAAPNGQRWTLGPWLRATPSHHVVLEAVAPAACQGFVESLLPLTPGWAAETVKLAEGRPDAARQLLEAWAAENRLVPSREGLVVKAGDTRLPLDVEHGEVLRLRRVVARQRHPDLAWRALYLAAAIGPVVNNADWLQACALHGAGGMGGNGAERLVSALVQAGLAWDEVHIWGLESHALAGYIEERARTHGEWDEIVAERDLGRG